LECEKRIKKNKEKVSGDKWPYLVGKQKGQIQMPKRKLN
jgi:hypothetical protein